MLRRMTVRRKRKRCGNIWPINRSAGNRPDGWLGWPEQKQFAVVLTHDVETAKGQRKCLELMKLEQELGFRSSFYFVPKRYEVSSDLRQHLVNHGFEVGVHGLYHDGKLYKCREIFKNRAQEINKYLLEWNAAGFRSPSMQRNLEWLQDLNIEYDASTFDTDPFEPQPNGVGTIFPFWVNVSAAKHGYVELPYTLPQDFTLFVLMKEKNIDIWKRKLDWIAENEGMALLNTHPDYMSFGESRRRIDEYPVDYYVDFLKYIGVKYEGRYTWLLPRQMASLWKENHNYGSRWGVSGSLNISEGRYLIS